MTMGNIIRKNMSKLTKIKVKLVTIIIKMYI